MNARILFKSCCIIIKFIVQHHRLLFSNNYYYFMWWRNTWRGVQTSKKKWSRGESRPARRIESRSKRVFFSGGGRSMNFSVFSRFFSITTCTCTMYTHTIITDYTYIHTYILVEGFFSGGGRLMNFSVFFLFFSYYYLYTYNVHIYILLYTYLYIYFIILCTWLVVFFSHAVSAHHSFKVIHSSWS